MTSPRLAATAGLALAMAGMGPMPHGIGSGFASPRGLGKRGRNGSRFTFASGVRERARLRRRRLGVIRHPAFTFQREDRGGLLSWYGERVRLHVSIDDDDRDCYWTLGPGMAMSESIDLGDDADVVVRAALVALANADPAGETR